MRSRVSVIIPNYNYANYLCEAIDSVLNQTYPHIEIIVVDDGSSDDSAKTLQNYGDKIKAVFQENAGVSAARNRGVAVSTGEFVAFLDADDAWLPEKVEKQIKLFETEDDLGLVHVGVQEIDDRGDAVRMRLDGLSGSVSDEFLLFERPVVLGGGSGAMIPRTIFDEVGGFDVDLQTSADWDLFYRVSMNRKIGFVSEVLLKYRIHDSNMHSNIERMESDMLAAYGKAFANADQMTGSIRNTAYGNLHKVLAGSYFRRGQYRHFLRHAVNSLRRSPKNFFYFAGFPIRVLKRG